MFSVILEHFSGTDINFHPSIYRLSVASSCLSCLIIASSQSTHQATMVTRSTSSRPTHTLAHTELNASCFGDLGLSRSHAGTRVDCRESSSFTTHLSTAEPEATRTHTNTHICSSSQVSRPQPGRPVRAVGKDATSGNTTTSTGAHWICLLSQKGYIELLVTHNVGNISWVSLCVRYSALNFFFYQHLKISRINYVIIWR